MKSNERKISVLFSMLFLVMVFSMFWSCDLIKGDEGPQGIEGPQGKNGVDGNDGIDGTNGNANVKMYIFSGNIFKKGRPITTRNVNMKKKEYDSTIFLVYLEYNERWYPIPGRIGFDSEFNYRIRHFSQASGNFASIAIELSGGKGEAITNIRVIAIETSPGHRINLSDIHFKNYEATAKYFGFKEY